MSLISVNNLTFHYEGSFDEIFEDVSFQIDTDWKLGFTARNGRGKTTFLKLLMGEYEYRGSISCNESFDYFPFEIRDRERSFLEIIEELYPEYELWKVCKELSLLQAEEEILYRPFYTLSNGEQTKAMLAVLFSQESRFLLIDEPTNHLDVRGRKSIREYLKQKKGFILVSHDRDLLDECVDHILVINKTDIEVYKGNFSTWWEEKKRRDNWEREENERLKKDIKRLKESARVKEEWADNIESRKIGKKAYEEVKRKGISTKGRRAYIGEKTRRMEKRRKNLENREERAIEEKSKLLKNLETAEDLKLFPLRHYKDVSVSLSDVCIYYGQEDGSQKNLGTVSFDIRNGECVVLCGKNGCGKSSILKAVIQAAEEKEGMVPGESLSMTEPICYTGTITTAGGLKISYVPQDTSHLRGSLIDYAEQYHLNLSSFLMLLRKLDLEREQFEKNLEEYSGGQKKKVLIARSLSEQAHLYIWDESLNFIDVFSRMQIEELLTKYRPTMLLVEHDTAFVEKVGSKIIEM
ncbi:ABC-F type ribosomal protection protein [Lachnospiraceae bacterium 38-10]